ncbi:hypothetical protein [Massilia endophytica]|uniref:hypothetical protein n=1 Tax=Massilia endophytica TaxID=2899220 RepID=UPI001E41BCE7|nr:hypothetical protein [Massilia endophytica]UGQ47438.1 hypothetical protein LSQ66_02865 [Massilia endophytica]
MPKQNTEAVVTSLVDSLCGVEQERKRHVLREALFGLVRLAKAEQMVAIRQDCERAAGIAAGARHRRHTRAMLRKIAMDVNSGQRRLEFEQSRDEQNKPR